MKALTIIGRRWFDRTYGNTYHTCGILIDGKLVHTVPMSYGYDNQYVQSATAWLLANGYLADLEEYPNGGHEAMWQWADRTGIEYHATASDVARKKDL